MGDLTPEMKKAIEKHLKKMNEELAKAIEDAKAGKNKDAIEHIKKAIAEKQKVIGALPGVEDAEGITIPFAVIYDLFSEFDELGFLVGQYIAATHATPPVAREQIDALIERIKRAINEIRRKLIDRYTLPPGVEELVKGMIEELERLMQLLKDAEEGKAVDWDQVERAQRLIRAYKKGFFEAFKSVLPLWDIYDMLYEIDEDLQWALSGLARGYPPDSRPGRMTRGQIERAKATKEKLEALISQRQYPPGSEDLPPFPPPDWAMREVRKRATSSRPSGKAIKG